MNVITNIIRSNNCARKIWVQMQCKVNSYERVAVQSTQMDIIRMLVTLQGLMFPRALH